jgi:hypothetical protein
LDGKLQHEGDFIKFIGTFDRKKLKVKAFTPYEEIEVTNFEIIKKDFPDEPISRWVYAEAVFLALCLIFGWWLKKQIF